MLTAEGGEVLESIWARNPRLGDGGTKAVAEVQARAPVPTRIGWKRAYASASITVLLGSLADFLVDAIPSAVIWPVAVVLFFVVDKLIGRWLDRRSTEKS